MLLPALAAGSIQISLCMTGAAQALASTGESLGTAASSHAATVPLAVPRAPAIQTLGSGRGATRFMQVWGIDNLKLEPTASGGLIRFSYRVVDATKAAVLNDKKKDPYLLVEKTGTKLGLQTAERVGQLRQVATPEDGRTYWMIFGNSGHLVRPGDRVDIVIGTFRAYGLFVEAPQAALVDRR